MARGDINCPVCNQILGLPNFNFAGGAKNDAEEIGGHVHVNVAGNFTCPNNHRFQAESGFILRRTS